MKYVLDTSVAFKWVVDEDLAHEARRFRQSRGKDGLLIDFVSHLG